MISFVPCLMENDMTERKLNDTRMLVSLPKSMLADAHKVAKERGISTAELVRRALSDVLCQKAAGKNPGP